jgi:2-phospho-L-lactate guanylyltransferase
MKATILIPAKTLASAKSRLTKHLSREKREKLVLEMLQHVIETVKASDSQYEIFVVTNDQKVETLANSFETKIIQEKNPGQNRALTFAAKQINQHMPVLTISEDLPLLKSSDIKNLFLLMKDTDIVLAPSKEKTGTNAILMRQPLLIPYQFGKNSLTKFISSTKNEKQRYKLYEKETIAFDIDTVQDLEKMQTI